MGHTIWSSFDRSPTRWRRRELHLDGKLLIKIGLMSLKLRFCYIRCYIE